MCFLSIHWLSPAKVHRLQRASFIFRWTARSSSKDLRNWSLLQSNSGQRILRGRLLIHRQPLTIFWPGWLSTAVRTAPTWSSWARAASRGGARWGGSVSPAGGRSGPGRSASWRWWRCTGSAWSVRWTAWSVSSISGSVIKIGGFPCAQTLRTVVDKIYNTLYWIF